MLKIIYKNEEPNQAGQVFAVAEIGAYLNVVHVLPTSLPHYPWVRLNVICGLN